MIGIERRVEMGISKRREDRWESGAGVRWGSAEGGKTDWNQEQERDEQREGQLLAIDGAPTSPSSLTVHPSSP